MLRLRFRNEKNTYDESKVEHDIEKLFFSTSLLKNEKTERILKEIEMAEYVSNVKYRDRFGITLSTDNLSTGTKAALCVAYHPDKIIDLIECGYNAIDAIISICDEGTILDSEHTSAVYSAVGEIDVEFDNRHFINIDELNNYIEERGI